MLAKLSVRLLAGDTLVAESDAPTLWASVLGHIQAEGLPCTAPSPDALLLCTLGADDAYPTAPWMVRCDGVRTLFGGGR